MSDSDTAGKIDKPVVTDHEAKRIAFASFVGTAMEWYDYFLFGTAASIVFNRLFFVTGNATAATLSAFASFALGFVARPVGALIFGHLGDRIGRRRTLLITVMLIGIATGLIGALPDFLTIGIAAPLLLTVLRVLQGIAVGGEWSGAITMAVEHAPPERRGRYAVMPQLGSPIGTLASAGAFALVSMLPADSFDAWGWRLPFLAAFPLLVVAVYLRRKMEESPLFVELLAQEERAAVPALEVFRQGFGRIATGMAISMVGVGGFFLLTTFVISYGTETLGLSNTLMLSATLVGAAAEILILLFFGRVAERIGSGKVCTYGGLASAALAFPVFWIIDTREPALVILGVTIGISVLSIPYAVYGPLISELFPPRLRYSGVGISYNLGGAVSGFVPMVATALLAASGGKSWSVALILVTLSLATAIGGTLGARLRIHDDVHTATQPR
ncbi:putative MFS family arabinose efflux permease [Tamaricihabitans halophyticus]|uniref:Putative MFS family arabinose efflux permease n=1 Tax=Tamaricihabitans halophyticus TaxID=1262583 RepID=A0A4R2QEY3_9PSEU|nr:MFS transporter [Tamaricihabitans halophyticus]TCP47219.1 putative MFS family arabinose efflux permease [Tamaricihabitans halophyticus]